MLRRTLLVFVGVLFVGLALTVGYAVAGLSGPETALAEASTAYSRGQYMEAVRVLDMAERSVRGSSELMEELLGIRYRAQQRGSNYLRALQDIERLLDLLLELKKSAPDDVRVDHIELLARLGRGQDALNRAQKFLAEQPDHGRALELAGEACQTLYQEGMETLMSELRHDLSGDEERTALEAARAVLYLPDGDPEIDTHSEDLHALFRRYVRLRAAWAPTLQKLQSLRKHVQLGLSYYRRSLECEGQPVGAWIGLADALRFSGRTDDLLALAEIYLRRYDHIYTQQPANRIAQTHFDAGRMEAVVAIADRYLPTGTWQQRLEDGRLAASVDTMLMLKGRALLALDRLDKLAPLCRDTREMVAAGLPTVRTNHFLTGMLHARGNNKANGEAHLAAFCRIERGLPPPAEGTDLLGAAVLQRVALARERGADTEEIVALFDIWLKGVGRERAPLPFVHRARYHMAIGDWGAAWANANKAMDRSPQDEELLHLLAETANGFYALTRQDGPSLLAWCLEQQIGVPPVPHPIQLLLTADAAVQAKVWPIALPCAQRSIDSFTWARWPRLLAARTLTALRQYENTEHTLRELLEIHPNDPEALTELWRVRIAADRPVDDQALDLIRNAEPEPFVRAALLRAASDRQSRHLAGLAARAEQIGSNDIELVAQLARTWALAGNLQKARETAERMTQLIAADDDSSSAPVDPWIRHQVSQATAALLVASAADTTDADLEELARDLVATRSHRDGGDIDVLWGAAQRLADLDRPRTAYRLLRAVIDDDATSDQRLGVHHALAGRVALSLSQHDVARRHLTAAVSFPDGGDAVPALALLLLTDGDIDKARRALALKPVSTRHALALRLQTDAELPDGLAEQLAADPTDLANWCLLACALPDAPTPPWPQLPALCAQSREPLLELLACLEEPGFQERALTLARQLAAKNADSLPAQLLLARALGATGDVAAAQTIHGDLATARTDPGVLTESARMSRQVPGYRLPDPIWQEVLKIAATTPETMSPLLRVVFAQNVATGLFAQGQVERASRVLARAWIDHPVESGARLADANALFRSGQERLSFAVLQALAPSIENEERAEYLDALFTVANTLVGRGDEVLAETTRRVAEQIVENEAPFGSVVHYLLADDVRRHGEPEGRDDAAARSRADRALELLRGHVELFIAGSDPMLGSLQQTIVELARRTSVAEALTVTDRVLRGDPSLIPLWLQRATLLEQVGDPTQALAELRHLSAYIDDAELALELARLAGTHGLQLPDDIAYLTRVAADQLDAPRSLLVRGILALRAARYRDAASLLARAAPRPDGAHLYFRGLANLALRDPGSGKRAQAVFRRLVKSYPSSSLTLNAGSFARQLSP